MSTLYDELELSPKASLGTIKAAYKALIQRCHPDKNSGDRESALRTQRLNGAYEVLSDTSKRAAYDAKLSAEDRLNRERDEARRRAVSESAARSAAAEAELRREMDAARAESAAKRAAEVEQERRRNSRDEEDRQAARAKAAIAARKLHTTRSNQSEPTRVTQPPPPRPAPPPRYAPPSEPVPKRGGFSQGLGKLILWGFAWLLGSMIAPYKLVGQSAGCRSNLMRVTRAFQMYADDYQEVTPPGKNWMLSIEPYLDRPGRLNCPSVSEPDKYGYAMNSEMAIATISSIRVMPLMCPLGAFRPSFISALQTLQRSTYSASNHRW